MPDKDGAESPDQKVRNDLNAPTEEEKAAEALAAKGPQEDNELAEALGSSSQPAEPVAASAAPVALSEAPPAEAANTATDGLQIPAGYRVEGLTPAAAAPEAPAVAAPTQPAADDKLPIPAGYRIETLTPAAEAVASTPPTIAASQQPAPPAPVAAAAAATATSAVAASADLKVDGLQVPAGWKITSIVDDSTPDAASDSPAATPPKPQAPAPKAQVASLHETPQLTEAEKAGVNQFEALKSKAMPAKERTLAEAEKQRKQRNIDFEAKQFDALHPGEAAAQATAAAQEKQRVAQAAQKEALQAAKTAAQSEHKSFGDMIKAQTEERMRLDNSPGRPDGFTATTHLAEAPPASLRGPVDGTPPEGSVIDKVLNIVHPVNTIAPYVPVVALGHITSVDCLTETLDNGGRPCKSEYEKSLEAQQAHLAQTLKAQADAIAIAAPKAKRTFLTKGSAHREQSITKVKSAHHHVDVTQVISREPAQTVHDEKPAVKVVHHEHRYVQHRVQSSKQATLDAQQPQKGSMADLVSTNL